MLRRTKTFVLVSCLWTGCLASPEDGPAPALAHNQDPATTPDAGRDTSVVSHSDDFAGDASRAAQDGAPDAASDEPKSGDDASLDAGSARDDAASSADDAASSAEDAGHDPEDAGDEPDASPAPELGCAAEAVFTTHCVGCHGVGARNGVELDALAKLGADSAKYPGTTIAARAVARMRDSARPMPPRSDLVPEAEISAVEAWIAAGMPAATCP